MFDLYIYRFDKRTNSTSIPSDASGYLVENVKLKEDTSILNPTFIVNKNTISTDSNYIKMEREGYKTRYYFINDIIMCIGNIAEIKCTQDHLATWKTEIGNTTQYVTRSFTSKNPYITDTIYPIITHKECVHGEINNSFFNYTSIGTTNSGIYVVGVILDNPPATFPDSYYADIGILNRGGVYYLIMDATSFTIFYNKLQALKQEIPSSISSTPLEYVVSCLFVPISIQDIGTPYAGHIWLNEDWNVPVTFWAFTGSSRRFIGGTNDYRVEIPDHPQFVDGESNYLNSRPYSVHTLISGVFGSIDIDKTIYGDYLYCGMTVDVLSGYAYLHISNSSFNSVTAFYKSITNVRTMIAIPIQITATYETNSATSRMQIGQTIGTVISSVASSAVVGGFAGGPLGAVTAGAAGLIGAIPSIYNSMQTADSVKPLTFGANGSFIDAVTEYFKLLSVFQYMGSRGDFDKGYPLCETVKINTLAAYDNGSYGFSNGYILCDGADLYLPATRTEIDAIKTYMNTGFFYN